MKGGRAAQAILATAQRQRHETCGWPGCGHRFEPGEMRYRANDRLDYCSANGHGQIIWSRENGGAKS